MVEPSVGRGLAWDEGQQRMNYSELKKVGENNGLSELSPRVYIRSCVERCKKTWVITGFTVRIFI